MTHSAQPSPLVQGIKAFMLNLFGETPEIHARAGGLMNLYTDQKVNRYLGGFEIPTSWFQAVNPLFIVVFGPMLAVVIGGVGAVMASAVWMKLFPQLTNADGFETPLTPQTPQAEAAAETRAATP